MSSGLGTLLCVIGCTVLAAMQSDEKSRGEEPKGGLMKSSEEDRVSIVDFSKDTPVWRTVDDVVMGGISASGFKVVDGVGVFQGTVSLENNGGFASARSKPRLHDLSAYEGLVLRVKGDGKRYSVRLRTSPAFDGVSYQAEIQTKADEWTAIRVPFTKFKAVFRGRPVPSAPRLDPSQVHIFGLLIAGKQEGPFRFEIAQIDAYGPMAPGEGG
mgnify:CR=1 FL=1